MKDPNMMTVQIRKELHARLKAKAKQEDRSLSATIHRLLRAGLVQSSVISSHGDTLCSEQSVKTEALPKLSVEEKAGEAAS